MSMEESDDPAPRKKLSGMGMSRKLKMHRELHGGGGMLKGERLMAYFRKTFLDRPIEKLPIPYGAVATALGFSR